MTPRDSPSLATPPNTSGLEKIEPGDLNETQAEMITRAISSLAYLASEDNATMNAEDADDIDDQADAILNQLAAQLQGYGEILHYDHGEKCIWYQPRS
jgi:hypothetical protein